ncbi:SDR family oxidoreductase [Pseudogracilibacillus sp. SO30301A]|uniref:SDR family oxidoreductase n=1 Tax=Pseudogracilibacillus sp. SO30301A TaxID=3098291 RepID=UPI00300E132E
MNVLVVGANGQIGKQLIDLLKESDHTPVAMVRKEEQANTFQQAGVEAVVADLEGSVEKIAKAADGCDAVLFTAGSGGHTGADKTLLVDLDGAVKTIEATKQAGIKRFIMVSAFQANNREYWNEKIRHYYVAKHYADKELLRSGLTYTILRPGGLTNDPGTGKVLIGENLSGRGKISRADVAKIVFSCLDNEKTFNRSFDVVEGEEAIENALERL